MLLALALLLVLLVLLLLPQALRMPRSVLCGIKSLEVKM
jgi:hypothetical protein